MMAYINAPFKINFFIEYNCIIIIPVVIIGKLFYKQNTSLKSTFNIKINKKYSFYSCLGCFFISLSIQSWGEKHTHLQFSVFSYWDFCLFAFSEKNG